MIDIHVIEYYDPDQTEALLELEDGNVKLRAYCFPFTGIRNNNHVTLYAMQTHNIGPCVSWFAPSQTRNHPFAYHICAEVLDTKERIVRLGEFKILLDASIDSDFHEGSLICFDVVRLDY